jgi:hypothetical protein
LQSDGSIVTDTGKVYNEVYRGYDGKTYYTSESYVNEEINEEPTDKPA